MSDEYQRQVTDQIRLTPRDSTYVPEAPVELYVRNRRQPRSLAELAPIERQQLLCMWRNCDVEARLASGMFRDEDLEEDFPDELEVAEVVDAEGTIRYRLWGMNYGVIFLMAGELLECVAFTVQHDIEHWHIDQRPLFWAMDRALSREGHGFRQPASFCWWQQTCWDEIAGSEPGTLRSEPSIRGLFAGRN